MERYVLNGKRELFEEIFEVRADSDALFEPDFNAAAGHSLPIIKAPSGVSEITKAIWGISHNGETISTVDVSEALESDTYKNLIKKNPCIIPVTGFYKWKQTVKDPLPFFIRIHSRELLGLAGFYMETDNTREQFCVLTMDANVLIQPLDDSMPYILKPMNYKPWLLGNSVKILESGFSDTSLLPEMTVFRVPNLVNDPSNNSPELIQPIPKLRDED